MTDEKSAVMGAEASGCCDLVVANPPRRLGVVDVGLELSPLAGEVPTFFGKRGDLKGFEFLLMKSPVGVMAEDTSDNGLEKPAGLGVLGELIPGKFTTGCKAGRRGDFSERLEAG